MQVYNLVSRLETYHPTGRKFQDFLAFLISLPLDFIISGDFNVTYGNGSSDTVAMNNILLIYPIPCYNVDIAC